MRFVWVATLLLLSACATYSPLPLSDDPKILAKPAAETLRRNSATLERPYLRPHPVDLGAPLDDDAVAALAVLSNPDLKALRTRAGVADAQAFAARLLPDPVFDVGIDHILSGPDPVDNLAGALGFELTALRNWSVREQQADSHARQVHMDLAWAEWLTAGDARIQAVRLAALQKIAALTVSSRDVSRTMLHRVLRAAGRGDVAGERVQAARLANADAEQQARQAERELAAARLELNRLLGLPPDFRLRVAEVPLPPPPPTAEQQFALAKSMRVDLQALRDGYAAQEASVHQAVLDQFPNLSLSVNATRDTGQNVLLGPAISFTLPLWNRNRGGIAVARATRSALKGEYEARLFQARAEITAAVSGLTIARRQYADQNAELPRLRRYAEASRAAATRGDLSEAGADAAEQLLRARRTMLLRAKLAMAEQEIALELLTGAWREQWK